MISQGHHTRKRQKATWGNGPSVESLRELGERGTNHGLFRLQLGDVVSLFVALLARRGGHFS